MDHGNRTSQVAPGTVRGRRLFTLTEANRSLVLVRRIVADIICDYKRLSDLQETYETADASGRCDRAEDARRKMIRVVERIQDCARELEEVGVQLKDWVLGVVGFPCVTDGKEVTLCWQADDPAVSFWQEGDSELAEKRPIHTLPAGRTAASRTI